MYCSRCQNEIPDGTTECPVCGSITRRGFRKRHAALKFFIRFLDTLTMLAGVLHVFMLGTASHFVNQTTYGLYIEREIEYFLYPGLKAVDVIFAVLLIAIPVFSVMMRYKLMREQRIGRLFLAIALAVTTLWGIAYPMAIYAVTGIISTMLWFSVCQTIIYVLLAAGPTIVIMKSSRIYL